MKCKILRTMPGTKLSAWQTLGRITISADELSFLAMEAAFVFVFCC